MSKLFNNKQSLDINVEKYGKSTKKVHVRKPKGSRSTSLEKKVSSSSSSSEKRASTFSVIIVPFDILSAATNGAKDIGKSLSYIWSNDDTQKQIEENLKISVKGYATHSFPSALAIEVRKYGQDNLLIWSVDADVAGAKEEWYYLSRSNVTKKISIAEATAITKTNGDINTLHRRKQLVYVSHCSSNGINGDKIKQKFVGQNVSNNIEVIKSLNSLHFKIDAILKHLNLSIPESSEIIAIKIEPGTGAVDVAMDGNNILDLTSSASPSLEPDPSVPPLPIFKSFDDIPKDLWHPFFNTYCLLLIGKDGNCSYNTTSVVAVLGGYIEYNSTQLRRLFHDTIKIKKANPNNCNDVILQNIISANIPESNILRDATWCRDDYMDTYMAITRDMFGVNVIVYDQHNKLAENIIKCGIGWNANYGNVFVQYNGSHWNAMIPFDARSMFINYNIGSNLGEHLKNKPEDKTYCDWCDGVIAKNNKRVYFCSGDQCMKMLHFKCVKSAITNYKDIDIDDVVFKCCDCTNDPMLVNASNRLLWSAQDNDAMDTSDES